MPSRYVLLNPSRDTKMIVEEMNPHPRNLVQRLLLWALRKVSPDEIFLVRIGDSVGLIQRQEAEAIWKQLITEWKPNPKSETTVLRVSVNEETGELT